MNNENQLPWYKRVYRWGQTNITELDPIRYDIDWWREHWRRTRVQGIIVNAGGIVAYYPSRYPEVHRALYLGERDLYGEIVCAAHEEGLAVLARMDSNRVHERFYIEHPDWCAIDAAGNPYKAGDLYITCINSGYYQEYLPAIIREIIERSHPEGIADNSFSGLDRNHICYCDNCARSFRKATGMDLPKVKDWESPVYRKWIEWNYARRLEVWDLNNQITKDAGGKDCLWIGMVGGDMVSESVRFRDYKAICERAEVILLDFQARNNAHGFQSNGEAGKLIHGLLGWDKIIPESMAMYQAGRPAFRVASKPEPEARLWVLEGFAGTIQPWWHHIGAYHEDRRQYRTAEPLFRWHEENEQYLANRHPIATVGVVWSQRNVDYYGRDDAEIRISLPWRGIRNALIRARIPYLPVHIDRIEQDCESLSVLILPNIGAMSDAQCASIRRFVERGGSLIATGETSLYDEWGDPRDDFALADLFGAHSLRTHLGSHSSEGNSWDDWSGHTYLRLIPELRGKVCGPRIGTEPSITQGRHPVLEGFDETDILPFGGRLEVVSTDANSKVLLTFVPAFPIYPPETAWMRIPNTTLPGLIINELGNGGRVAYLPADIDRCYGRDNLPDHGHLLANLIRWASRDDIPLKVEGRGLIDCHLYQQPGRLILHLVNLTNAETWLAPVHELISVGPIRVSVRLPQDVVGDKVCLRVIGLEMKAKIGDRWTSFDIPSITDHELIIIS
ncbi:MAG: Tat pathway signal protein [Firmicutes bacterium]|nr:Tat pathway signal protein [Bacillota bacterium]